MDENAFSMVAVFYSVANLASWAGAKPRETVQSLRSIRVLGLALGWSWLLGDPAVC